MKPNLSKLLEIASPALCDEVLQVPQPLLRAKTLGDQLIELLNKRNGFYAFERSLHLFPIGCQTYHIDFESWNRDDSWRSNYGSIVNDYLFFAEDVFGSQFGLCDAHVCKFDPETGEIEVIAADLEEWATKILSDYEYETGYVLAHEWQEQHGPLAKGKQLLPKVPFVLGGAYEVENLYAADALKAMEFRADLWRQIRDLPDGAEVKLKIIA